MLITIFCVEQILSCDEQIQQNQIQQNQIQQNQDLNLDIIKQPLAELHGQTYNQLFFEVLQHVSPSYNKGHHYYDVFYKQICFFAHVSQKLTKDIEEFKTELLATKVFSIFDLITNWNEYDSYINNQDFINIIKDKSDYEVFSALLFTYAYHSSKESNIEKRILESYFVSQISRENKTDDLFQKLFISNNQDSLQTLVFIFTAWKEKFINLFNFSILSSWMSQLYKILNLSTNSSDFLQTFQTFFLEMLKIFTEPNKDNDNFITYLQTQLHINEEVINCFLNLLKEEGGASEIVTKFKADCEHILKKREKEMDDFFRSKLNELIDYFPKNSPKVMEDFLEGDQKEIENFLGNNQEEKAYFIGRYIKKMEDLLGSAQKEIADFLRIKLKEMDIKNTEYIKFLSYFHQNIDQCDIDYFKNKTQQEAIKFTSKKFIKYLYQESMQYINKKTIPQINNPIDRKYFIYNGLYKDDEISLSLSQQLLRLKAFFAFITTTDEQNISIIFDYIFQPLPSNREERIQEQEILDNKALQYDINQDDFRLAYYLNYRNVVQDIEEINKMVENFCWDFLSTGHSVFLDKQTEKIINQMYVLIYSQSKQNTEFLNVIKNKKLESENNILNSSKKQEKKNSEDFFSPFVYVIPQKQNNIKQENIKIEEEQDIQELEQQIKQENIKIEEEPDMQELAQQIKQEKIEIKQEKGTQIKTIEDLQKLLEETDQEIKNTTGNNYQQTIRNFKKKVQLAIKTWAIQQKLLEAKINTERINRQLFSAKIEQQEKAFKQNQLQEGLWPIQQAKNTDQNMVLAYKELGENFQK